MPADQADTGLLSLEKNEKVDDVIVLRRYEHSVNVRYEFRCEMKTICVFESDLTGWLRRAYKYVEHTKRKQSKGLPECGRPFERLGEK